MDVPPPASSGASLPLAFTTAKAGMPQPTASLIESVLQKHKHTPYFRKQEQKRLENEQKVAFYREKIKRVKEQTQICQRLEKTFQSEVKQVLERRDYDKHWAHIDLDMFYVAVEIRDRPELADKPVAVGNSVISTSNYVARGFGVRSAMPTHIAFELCPQLIMLELNFEK